MPRIKNKDVGKPNVLPWSPDDQVITELEAAKFCGCSRDLIRRRVRAGDGPPVIRLSSHRIGYRIRDLRAWLDANTEAGS